MRWTRHNSCIFPFLGGSRFHKRCFKCISCSKKLDSNNVRVSGNKLYCKVCLDKVAPPETPKIYSDTSVIAPTDEKGCPRQVYNIFNQNWCLTLYPIGFVITPPRMPRISDLETTLFELNIMVKSGLVCFDLKFY